ncbi:MAG: TniB family NTP-binding protein [Betaproteobacteria bacterium]|nr:TniB family NTP-binding protein [Betaproteobacteria bacterium]
MHESVRPIAELGAEERIAHLRHDRWIDHPLASQALQRLELLLTTPRRTRMPCLLIYGDSGMGKTMIVEKFKRAHRPFFEPQRGIEHIDVLAVQMPPVPSQSRFYGQILQALGAPYRPSDRLFAVETVAMGILNEIRPRMIVVDEVHHLLAGTARDQRAALNQLKFLANALQCSVVALGTQDARTAMQTDPQISSRFRPLELPRWREGESLQRFLAAFERLLPLRQPSRLGDRALARAVLDRSGGITGNVAEILVQSAEAAIRRGREHIDLELLEEAAQLAIA